MTDLGYRTLAFFGAAACALAMAFALYLEYFEGLEPCPMCVFQRVAMTATGIAFLIGAAHNPVDAGRWFYSAVAAICAGAGAGIAGRHVWLQSLPPDQVPACGPTLDYLLEAMPFAEVLKAVISGDGNCAIIDAAFLGVSLPAWTLIAFIGLALFALTCPLLARKRSVYI